MKKRLFTLALAGLMTVSSVAVLAAETAEEEAPVLISAEADAETEAEIVASYVSFSGKVTDVTEDAITIKNDTEDIFLNTAYLQLILNAKGEAAEIKKDDEITAYVGANMPAPLVLPAEYSPAVIVIGAEDGMNVDVDNYAAVEDTDTEAYINAAGNLVINIGEETAVLDAEGNAFEGEVAGSDLVVFYDITTRSIPAQAAPKTVYVLAAVEEEADVETEADEDAAVDTETEAEVDDTMDIAAIKKITANGKELTFAPVNGMLPLREAAEALGFKVDWDGNLRAVTVGNAYTLNIGKNSYTKGKMMPAELSAAPVLVPINGTGVTYVPFEYFTEILEAKAAQNGEVLELTLAAEADEL